MIPASRLGTPRIRRVLAALHLTTSHRRDEHLPRGIKKSFARDVLQNNLRRSPSYGKTPPPSRANAELPVSAAAAGEELEMQIGHFFGDFHKKKESV